MPQKTISLSNLTKFKQELDSTYGQANQPAKLDNQGKVPQAQLPSDVYNVLEYGTFSAFPAQGEAKKLYIDKSTNNMYRWETNAYVSVSAPESIKYVAQVLTSEQKTQARQNIDALAASELPESILRYDEQTLTEAQQTQARDNINALGKDELPENVVTYSPQSLEPEEKVQARTNIGAASATEVGGLTTAVENIEDRLNNFGNFVRKVEESENGIKVTYDNNQITNIETGLVFDGGYVDDNNYLYLKHGDTILPDDVFTPVKLPEGGGGGSAIALTDVVKVNTVRNGKDAIFSFVATTSDDSDVTVKWYVNNSKDPYLTEAKSSGSRFTFNAKDYLIPSSSQNSVGVVIESGGGSSLSRKWSVTTIAFAIEWGSSISPIMLYTTNANVYAPINVSAEANTNNVVTVTIGQHTITKNVTGTQTITVEINKSFFATGANVVVAGMHSATDPDDRADDIQFTAIWGYQASSPVVAFAKSYDECTQYDVYNIQYFAFDPENEIANCSIRVGAGAPVSVSAPRRMQTYQYSPLVEETITITLTCGSASTSMTLKVNKSDYNLSYYKDDSLQYDLNPVGHSNTDADREQFGDLTFSQNFDWENGGFQNDPDGVRAFVVKKGDRVTLPRSLFEDSDVNGKTIDISFKVTNSDQYDAVAMQDMNNGLTRGVILRANNGEIRLNNVAGQEFRYSEESRIDMSVLVEKYDLDDTQRIITVWLDGVPSKVNAYSANMLVQNENEMVVGSDHCDVWLYNVRVYNAALTKQQMIQNYISNGRSTEDKVDRYKKNTILDNNDRITPAALHTAVPNLTIVHISAPRMTVSKEDPVPADITITDGSTVLELPAASSPTAKDGALFKVQGTSSAAYGRSSYNLDLDFKGTGKKYKISENAIAVNYINIKVNVASSENANNINCVDWYNTFQPYITISRQTPGVRDTVEGKPCALFFTNTAAESVWFSSQYVAPGETILYAMGDICNSKKNKEVFGQDGKGEHYTKCCIEVSGNDTEPQRFRSTAAVFNPEADDGKGRWETQEWDEQQQKYKTVKQFEWRMNPKEEDQDEVVQAWDDLVAWVVSTIDNSAKFKAEANNYFAMQSMLYHFLFLEYFACYDNVSKNTFYSYDWDEASQKYLWNIKAAYDMDTVLAADNDGKPYGDYGIDYGDTENGRSYFNAVTNPIWVNIKAAYQSELSTLYNTLRGAGAWNSNDIVSKWDVYQAKRPQATMIMDAYIKYVYPYKTKGMIIDGEVKSYDDSYLPRMQGSKTYWRKQFLTYQTSYMDGKYGIASTTNSISWRTNCDSSTRNYSIKAYAKTYITVLVDSQRVASVKVNTGEEKYFENVSVGTNTTLYVKPDRLIQYIRPLNDTKNSTFAASGAAKLTEALLGGEDVNMSWPSGTGVSIPSVLLKDLSIRNMPNFSDALNLAQNVELETLDSRNTSAGSVVLPSFSPLRTIMLNACTGIEAHNLHSVETMTMESGNNLESIIVDTCNNTFNTAIATYLTQATNTQVAATRRIRAVAIQWSFSNLNVLYKIVTSWKGYNNLGEEQDKPVVTGTAHVTSLSKKKLEAIHAMWGVGSLEDALDEENKIYTSPNLIITYDVVIPYYPVNFKNRDNTPIKDKKGNDYIQYVDMGDEAYDPITAGEVNTPTYIDPQGQYEYEFIGWDNLSGPVYEEKDVTATYTETIITYTVRWYDKVGGTLYDIRENVPFGSEAIYDPEGTIGFPVNTEMEVANTYNLFTGWDKSTGYIRQNTDVYATWSTGQMPVTGTPMKDMNVAQIYGITKITPTKSSSANVYFNDQTGESYTDITVGRDFEFSNVSSALLLSERYFDGTEMYKMPDVKLFDENADNFTLAIDYEFTRADNNATIACCCDNSTGDGEGFRLFYNPSNNSINIRWGDQIDTIGYGLNHGIVVLRHRKGSKNLYVASNYGGRTFVIPYWENQYGMDRPNTSVTSDETRYGAYYQTMHARELARAQATSTNNGLTFGAIPIGDYGKSSPAQGWIHWCKIWYDDLGVTAIKEMANWPRETWRMQYRGMNLYNRADSTGWNDGASFIASAPLDQVYEMYPLNQIDTTGGWTNSPLRSFINDRCFKALPYSWQQLIKTMNIKTKGGADNPAALEYTPDKLYIPSASDMAGNMPEYVRDESTQIKWFTTNFDRPKYLGIKVHENANIITDTATDPTLLTETYTIKEGDVWYPTGQSGYYVKSYVYVSADTAAKHGIKGGRPIDNLNNIAAAGAQGGYWIGSFTYWTRSNPTTASSNREYHYTVYPSGAVSRNAYIRESYSKNRGVVLMFSI